MKPIMKITYIAIIASTLVIAGLAVVPTIASDDRNGGAVTVATGEIGSRIVRTLADDYVDLDGDGANDVRLRIREPFSVFTGSLDGDAFYIQRLTNRLPSNDYTWTSVGDFNGRLGASEVGTFSFIMTGSGSPAATGRPFTGKFNVVQGSGSGGLEGICGGGTFEGSGPPGGPYVTTYDLILRFGKDCKANN